jgi:hypothetical protein
MDAYERVVRAASVAMRRQHPDITLPKDVTPDARTPKLVTAHARLTARQSKCRCVRCWWIVGRGSWGSWIVGRARFRVQVAYTLSRTPRAGRPVAAASAAV